MPLCDGGGMYLIRKSNLHQLLDKACKQHNFKGELRSESEAISALSDLLESGLSEHQFRFVHWLHQVSVQHTTATVRRYLSTFTTAWFAYAEDVDLDAMDSDEYFSLYSNIIEQAKEVKTKTYNAGRLQQFHRHCLNHFSAPVLAEAIPYANNKEEVAHTRAGFVGESLFQALLIRPKQLV